MTEQLRENRGGSHCVRSSIDALIPFIAQMSPTNPVCIPPYTERLPLFRIRPDTQNVPVEVLDLHLYPHSKLLGGFRIFAPDVT